MSEAFAEGVPIPSAGRSGAQYRVVHLVTDNLLLNSNWKLRFSTRSDGTSNLMFRDQMGGPVCIQFTSYDLRHFGLIFLVYSF